MLKKKRKRVAALLVGCMVLGSSMSVFAGDTVDNILGKRISLSVSARVATAETGGTHAKTTINGYRYITGGNANQLIAMEPKSGEQSVTTYPPNGWNIGKATSTHWYGGLHKNLVAYE